jgi:hypothetical protein
MSYCRIGFDSDVYVVHHVGGGMACYCGTPVEDNLMTKPEMVEHLLAHREEGALVPQRALDRLYREIAAEEEESDDDA